MTTRVTLHRLNTGVPGLDDVLGGLPEFSFNLIVMTSRQATTFLVGEYFTETDANPVFAVADEKARPRSAGPGRCPRRDPGRPRRRRPGRRRAGRGVMSPAP